jgi:hypothetical protein
MDILFAILAVLGFVTGMGSIMVSAYSNISNRAKIDVELSNIRVDALGIESRIEGALDRKLDKALLDMRQTVQGDSLEILQNTLSSTNPGPDLGIANFNHFGD